MSISRSRYEDTIRAYEMLQKSGRIPKDWIFWATIYPPGMTPKPAAEDRPAPFFRNFNAAIVAMDFDRATELLVRNLKLKVGKKGFERLSIALEAVFDAGGENERENHYCGD